MSKSEGFDNPFTAAFAGIDAPNDPKPDPEVESQVNELLKKISDNGEQISPITERAFKDPRLFRALSEALGDSAETASYIYNSSKFFENIHTERQKPRNKDYSGLLGEVVEISESAHADGRVRRPEQGNRLNIEYLRTIGIDPSKVLFFRVTQPSKEAKPEYYWTSDFFETVGGLSAEIPTDQRQSSVVIVASLEAINGNEGLIQDMNDDSGMAVRQIGLGNFDQGLALATIKD